MTTVRSAKVKGSQFEYDCQYSLQQWTSAPVTRTSERGFQLQYDLRIDYENGEYTPIECKRLAGISWNQLVKFYEKLEKKTPDASLRYLLFKSNNQPCLVFYKEFKDSKRYLIRSFEDHFMVQFQKHPSTRAKKDIVEPAKS